MTERHVHFVTGRLAENALRAVLAELAPRAGFTYSLGVMPITVAALMTPQWIAARLAPPPEATEILLPGYCQGDLAPVEQAARLPVSVGPKDLRQLPEFFGRGAAERKDYGAWDIEIIAEINHAPRLTLAEILAEAERLRAAGADLIDVGCDPGGTWSSVAECVRALREAGNRVSIDSLAPAEIEPAVRAGAELVLSVNSSNVHAAADWGCEVVAIPDDPAGCAGLEETVEALAVAGVPLRIDPILEPIGFGFAASLERYMQTRRKYPDAAMMMGIGNLTELTDVDSAGVNVLLLAVCQELQIHSVLTTQVINWARSSVAECDLARRLVRHSITQGVPPKHLEPLLVMLRDPRLLAHPPEFFEELAAQIKDRNYRLFAQQGEVHLVSAGLHLAGSDPFTVFEELMARDPGNLDPGHAFYLGFEMAKALTALTLGKQYRQDEALDWGLLTQPENRHYLKRPPKGRGGGAGEGGAEQAGPPENEEEA